MKPKTSAPEAGNLEKRGTCCALVTHEFSGYRYMERSTARGWRPRKVRTCQWWCRLRTNLPGRLGHFNLVPTGCGNLPKSGIGAGTSNDGKVPLLVGHSTLRRKGGLNLDPRTDFQQAVGRHMLLYSKSQVASASECCVNQHQEGQRQQISASRLSPLFSPVSALRSILLLRPPPVDRFRA